MGCKSTATLFVWEAEYTDFLEVSPGLVRDGTTIPLPTVLPSSALGF